MADQTQAKGKYNVKMPDGTWKYQRPNENPQNGGAQIKHWDSTNKPTTDTTNPPATDSTATNTTQPLNSEPARLRIKDMLEKSNKNKKV